MMTTVLVIQARLGSTRLPGKVLKAVGDSTVLDLVIDGVTAVGNSTVVLAVPRNDEALIDAARRRALAVVCGSELDVLSRFAAVVEQTGATTVVRITADCPLIDTQVVRGAIDAYAAADAAYLDVRGYPRGTGDVEVMSGAELLRAHRSATDPYQREHVGPWFLNELGTRARLLHAPERQRRPELRVCVDEAADLEVVRTIMQRTDGARPGVVQVIEILDGDPELRRLNAHVAQRS